MGCGHALFSFFVFVHETIPMKKKKDRFTKTGLGQAHISPGKLENKKMAFVYFFVSAQGDRSRQGQSDPVWRALLRGAVR
jgi:hypothetical protein